MKYIRGLDGLRALAVLLVIFFHYYHFIEIGWIGVQVFFVLSGYLITSILRASKHNTSFASYAKRFYWRRTLRIFPLYYLYLFIVLLVFILLAQPADFLNDAAYLFTYTFNLEPLINGYSIDTFYIHFWSLSVEEQFYIFWPFVIFFSNTKSLRLIIILLILMSPLIRYSLGEFLIQNDSYKAENIGEVIYRFTGSHLDAFAFGAAVNVFNMESIKKADSLFLFSFFVTLCLGFINYFNIISFDNTIGISSFGFPIGEMSNYQHVWSFTLLNLLSASLIILIINQNHKMGFVRRIFELKPFVEIGKISYGLYVYHWIIYVVFRNFIIKYTQNSILNLFIYLLVLMIVSYLSFVLFESKLLKYKDKNPLISSDKIKVFN